MIDNDAQFIISLELTIAKALRLIELWAIKSYILIGSKAAIYIFKDGSQIYYQPASNTLCERINA